MIRQIISIISLLCLAAYGGGGGSGEMITALAESDQPADEDTQTNIGVSDTSTIGQSEQIYVIERLNLGPQKRISVWESEQYQAQLTLDHVLIDSNGTIFGTPTQNPPAQLQYSADGTASGYIIYGSDPYTLSNGNLTLTLNSAQTGTLNLNGFEVIPMSAGQPTLENITINISNIAYLGSCGSADFCASSSQYCFASSGLIPSGTIATGSVLGGVFGPNAENAGGLLDASLTNTLEFRGEFVASQSP